jgi:hypothetical protein
LYHCNDTSVTPTTKMGWLVRARPYKITASHSNNSTDKLELPKPCHLVACSWTGLLTLASETFVSSTSESCVAARCCKSGFRLFPFLIQRCTTAQATHSFVLRSLTISSHQNRTYYSNVKEFRSFTNNLIPIQNFSLKVRTLLKPSVRFYTATSVAFKKRTPESNIRSKTSRIY